jgi:hypothetical protein
MTRSLVIKRVGTCNYCGGEVSVDAASGQVIHDLNLLASAPEGSECGSPCPHLVCYYVCVDVWRTKPDDSNKPEWTKTWLWERGRGQYAVDDQITQEQKELFDYLCVRGFGWLPCSLIPLAEHQFEGKSAMFREMEEPGSGMFLLGLDGKDVLHVTLDAYAVFAPLPKLVMDEIRTLSRGFDGEEYTGGRMLDS